MTWAKNHIEKQSTNEDMIFVFFQQLVLPNHCTFSFEHCNDTKTTTWEPKSNNTFQRMIKIKKSMIHHRKLTLRDCIFLIAKSGIFCKSPFMISAFSFDFFYYYWCFSCEHCKNSIIIENILLLFHYNRILEYLSFW